MTPHEPGMLPHQQPQKNWAECVDSFSKALDQALGDWQSIKQMFSNHAASSFLQDFISGELTDLASKPEHVVRRSVSQGNFTFIADLDFEYSVRILAPFPSRPRTVKWLGMRQIIAVKGPGSVTIRKLTLPRHLDIGAFQRGIAVEEVEIVNAGPGHIAALEHTHEIMEVYDVSGPVVVEILTYCRDGSGLFWTFDERLTSVYAEQSSVLLSRFRNVLELSRAAGRSIPDDIYELALDHARPHIALLAIGSMLRSGHPDAFVQLQIAMDSGCKVLRDGAGRLLDFITTGRSSDHAARA